MGFERGSIGVILKKQVNYGFFIGVGHVPEAGNTEMFTIGVSSCWL